MGKISLQDLASVLVERWHLGKKEASMFVNEMFFLIQKSLDEDKIVKVKGLGTFKIIDVDDRESVNVNTGDRVLIEGHGKITFTPDALMKELVNKPFSQFETVVLNEGVDFKETAADQSGEAEMIIPEDTEDSAAPLVEFVDEAPVEEPEIKVEQEPSKPEPTADLPKEEETNNMETVENSEEPGEKEVTDDFEEESGFKKYLKWIGFALLALAVFLIGYLAGRGPKATPQEPKTEAVEKDTIKSLTKDSATIKIETDVIEETIEDSEEVEEEEEEEEEKVADDVSAKDMDKWAAMDARVRTGAYRIIGTDQVLKAKAGDNIARICRRTLGPGMECYIEVYNGISKGTDIKAGQEIKIPKLELKKKRKK